MTSKFPDNEIFGNASQMRSVSGSMAEGSTRYPPKDELFFLHKSCSSLMELLSLTHISKGQGNGTSQKRIPVHGGNVANRRPSD